MPTSQSYIEWKSVSTKKSEYYHVYGHRPVNSQLDLCHRNSQVLPFAQTSLSSLRYLQIHPHYSNEILVPRPHSNAQLRSLPQTLLGTSL